MLEDILGIALGALRSRAQPNLTSLWLHLVAALLSLLGGLYLSYAIFLALEQQLGPPLAGALTGAFFLLLAGLALLWALISIRRQPKSENTAVAEALVRVGDLIGHKIEAPHASLAITAVLAGVVAGISPSARGFLLNLAEQLFKESTGEPK
jgi:MFS family permease